MENVRCYSCGGEASTPFISAEDDLTGNPGTFHFVRCDACGLVYQNPRVTLDRIKAYYDDNYIAHRGNNRWGILAPFYRWAMDKLDRDKDRLLSRYIALAGNHRVLDVGCGAGTFLERLRQRYGCSIVGVDFKDLTHLPSFKHMEFHCGVFYEQPLVDHSYDLITMWHFLEHDYEPLRSLETARRLIRSDGLMLVEVPRLDSLSFKLFGHRWPGLQAPQHTVLYTKESLLRCVKQTGWEVVDYLPYGAFPAYFYLFCGVAFKIRKGRGINLSRAIYPYFIGQIVTAPVMLFERSLNFAMQTVICRPHA